MWNQEEFNITVTQPSFVSTGIRKQMYVKVFRVNRLSKLA